MRQRFVLVFALCISAIVFPPAATADEEAIADVVTGVVPLSALAYTWMDHDKEGRKQLLYSTAVSYGINGALRLAFNDHEWGTRPNGHPYGFPSGHIGFIVASAAFVRERYGIAPALLPYAATGYVAWVRVDTEHHKWRDVVAAWAIAEAVAVFMVDEREDEKTTVAPVISDEFVGLSLRRRFG